MGSQVVQMREQIQKAPDFDAREEYRTIEAALLETARGRWFLTEHGRRARRLDSALLEDAIGKLQSSIRQPPALLGQLQMEVEGIRAQLMATRSELLQRATSVPKAAGAAGDAAGEPAGAGQPVNDQRSDESRTDDAAGKPSSDAQPMDKMLTAAEEIHELAWGLQAKDIDPDACESIARQAGALYALSMHQATYSTRILKLADALDATSQRIEGILQTIGHELRPDDDVHEPMAGVSELAPAAPPSIATPSAAPPADDVSPTPNPAAE